MDSRKRTSEWVVIGITGAVLAALLVANPEEGVTHGEVEQLREFAMRISAALHEHQHIRGEFPPLVDEYGFSWRVHILPQYVPELASTYAEIDWEAGPTAAANRRILVPLENRFAVGRTGEKRAALMPVGLNCGSEPCWPASSRDGDSTRLPMFDGESVHVLLLARDSTDWFVPHRTERAVMKCLDFRRLAEDSLVYGRVIGARVDGGAISIPSQHATAGACELLPK